MSKVFYVVFALILTVCLCSSAFSATPRIVNGTEVKDGAWPWTVALVVKGDDPYEAQSCAGTLVDRNWVVTAAHCTEGETPQTIDILAGQTVLSGTGGQRVDIKRIIDHPDYDALENDLDLSLIELADPVDLPLAMVVRQSDPESLTAVGQMCEVNGWGDTRWQSTDPYVDRMRQVDVPIYDFDLAQAAYTAINMPLTDNMLPAGYLEGLKDSCSGDSGGPLAHANSGAYTLVGVVSWGEGCAYPELPGIYTKLSKYRDWIQSYVSSLAYSYELLSMGNYLQANPDLSSMTPEQALAHFRNYGFAEGRIARFVPRQYLDANPDLEAAGFTVDNALSHYLNYGKDENRVLAFVAEEYLRANPDLSLAGIDATTAISHFINYGRAEKRAVFFHAKSYLDANPDLAAAGITETGALGHYLNHGRTEGRLLAFDAAAYLALNPDLAQAGYTEATAIEHYLAYGRTEGRPAMAITAQ